jgi:hypothetical protein
VSGVIWAQKLTVNQPRHRFAGSSPASPTRLRLLSNSYSCLFGSKQCCKQFGFPDLFLALALDEHELRSLLARRPDGIFVAPFEQGEIGPNLFRKACKFGLEGLVSKRRDRPYWGGRLKDWIKVKNRIHPATERMKDAFS